MQAVLAQQPMLLKAKEMGGELGLAVSWVGRRKGTGWLMQKFVIKEEVARREFGLFGPKVDLPASIMCNNFTRASSILDSLKLK